MSASNSPTETDSQIHDAKPLDQVQRDNKTIDWMVWLWTLLAPVAFVIIWKVF